MVSVSPGRKSVLESIARVLFAEAGLPPPVLQAQFWNGRWWMTERVDFWWPEFRTVAEADGLAKSSRRRPQRSVDGFSAVLSNATNGLRIATSNSCISAGRMLSGTPMS